MNWIVRLWNRYINWCDRMGLTPENRRSCAPRLKDPELKGRGDGRTNAGARRCVETRINKPKGGT